MSVRTNQRSLFVALLVVVAAMTASSPSWTQEAQSAVCARAFVMNLARSYACQRINNHQAMAQERPGAMIKKVPTPDGQASVFTDRTGEAVCGRFVPVGDLRSFDVSLGAKESMPRVMAFQTRMNATMNREDEGLQQWALAIADTFIHDQKEEKREVGPALTAVKAFETEVLATVAANSGAVVTPDCGLRIGGVGISLPSATGPDQGFLHRDKEVVDRYRRFDDWLKASIDKR